MTRACGLWYNTNKQPYLREGNTLDASAPKCKPMRTNNRKHPHQEDALSCHPSNEDKAGNAKETTTVKSIQSADRISHDHGPKRRKIIEPLNSGPATEGCDPKL